MPRLALRDGTLVDVRPIDPSDRGLLVEAFERLSPQARYRRFFSAVARLGDRQLDYLTDVDHGDHEALVAIAPGGELVGVARYVRTGPAVAEPAIVVADAWQGRGLATRLLGALVARARSEGIDTFVAPILAENRSAIRLFERLGPAHFQHDGREVELTIPLVGAPVAGARRPPLVRLRRRLRSLALGPALPALTFWQRVTTSSRPGAAAGRDVIVVGLGDETALERIAAACVALAHGAEFHIVAAQRFLLDDRDETAERLRGFERRLAAGGLHVDVHARRGDLAASLIDEAVREGAHLIVVDGAEPHGSAPLRGSTWDHVTHHAPCNVLIVR